MSMATRGQPAIEPWEQWRAIAWAHEVRRLAQCKMDQVPLPAKDPFSACRKLIQARWATPQRRVKNPNEVIMTDLDEVLLGSKRTDFYHYANGTKARPRAETLKLVEGVMPGTKTFFEVGPNGVPLWAALRGQITPEDFWEPLVKSGQVTDTLELFLEDMDWQDEGRNAPRPSLIGKRGTKLTNHQMNVLSGLIAYQSLIRLPKLPWEKLVRALALHMVPLEFRDGQNLEASTVEQQARDLRLFMGDTVLAIALAHQARAHRFNPEFCPKDACEDLRNILDGLIPIWQRWADFYNLGPSIAGEIKQLAAPL